MKRLTEQEIINNIDDDVTNILENLRDGVFRNKESRQEFIKLIVSLALSTDPRARKTIKRLGEYLTELGHELLGTMPEEDIPDVIKIDAETISNTDHNKIDLGLSECKRFKKYISIFEVIR